MSAPASQPTRSETVAVFDTAASLQTAIDDLLSAGFDRAELSFLASESAIEAKLGHLYRKAADLEDDPSVPRTAYVSTEAIGEAQGALIGGLIYVGAVATAGAAIAAGGTLAGAIVAAAMISGAGGLIGSVLAQLVGDHHAKHLQDQIDRGGLLLWVRTRDAAHEQRAKEVLLQNAARDVHSHVLPELT